MYNSSFKPLKKVIKGGGKVTKKEIFHTKSGQKLTVITVETNVKFANSK